MQLTAAIELAKPIVTNPLAVAGITGGIALIYNAVAGRKSIDRYTTAIERSTRRYAEQMGMTMKDFKEGEEKPLLMDRNIGSILIATTEELAMTKGVSGSATNVRRAVSLKDKEYGLARLSLAHGLLDKPEAIWDMLDEEVDASQSLPRALRRTVVNDNKNWSRTNWLTSAFDAFAKIKKDASAPKNREDRVNHALFMTAKVLAKSKEPFVNISGSCHLGLKWTDEAGKAHIVVMPTDNLESPLLAEILKRAGNTPKSVKTIIEAVTAKHAPRTAALKKELRV